MQRAKSNEQRAKSFTSKIIRRMYSHKMKTITRKIILIAFVKSLKIRVCLAHGKHIALGELHHRLQKQPFQLTSVHRQSLLLQISYCTTLLIEVKLLIMANICKNLRQNRFKILLKRIIKIVKETGHHVNIAFMFLGASPDTFVTCVCHQSVVLEIKYLFKFRKSLKKWNADNNPPH